ncbi:methyltransferase domain-containing protein [Thiocapsa roseopersicina]|uniref:Ubiquinone/menaquinone biosynthesis C-methylase UbiE n=1 Tax=Thiocapsa roseopersicina TaxID=1058 RepID=A0A1H3D4F6_THIRO|nr:methyltransferase domain-containing protein [Thiocapsa roseopersicina]SDX61180.1 Ubiquinone/menaquinone biosynthesis C-methylase UbiE [Thiocapsa roseopersicina]
MPAEYLAAGFPDVDASTRTADYTRCLELLDSLPYFRAYKARSAVLLDLHAGQTILEIGCGLGDDARRLAERVAPRGRVFGIDRSRRLLAEARARTAAANGLAFMQADARALPFATASVDRCRIDRVLQHIRDPQRAIDEAARVLRPGGRLLAYDNDWGTFALSSRLRATTALVQSRWAHAFTNPWIGRDLPRMLLAAGFHAVHVEPSVSLIRELDLADRVYNVSDTLDRAVRDGALSAAAAEAWRAEQALLGRTGGFLCSLTAYTVVGTK